VRYFEDFHEGQEFELGEKTVTREEILAFAREFDPQPFHVDERAAAASPFGGLVASGWHTAAMWMRLYVDAILARSSSIGSPGVEEIRWLRPVRPGDRLTGRARILWAKPSDTNPARGTIFAESELSNQDGEVVMRLRARGLFARRPPTKIEGDAST
jgi:acyl dehydratase